MMIKNYLILLLLSFPFTVLSQWGPQEVIFTGEVGSYRTQAVDIDNDGDLDLLTPRGPNFELSWFANDGAGNFGNEIVINTVPVVYLTLDFVDIDTDGDKDLIYLVNNPRRIAWLENLDGAGTFGPEQTIIENQPDFIQHVYPIDLDEDGDLDLATTYTNTSWGWMVWYENIDGQGTYGAEQALIPADMNFELFYPVFKDINNDGKPDLLNSLESLAPSKVVWYRNLGNATFGPPQEIFQFTYSSDSVSIGELKYSDINADGIGDVVLTAMHDDLGTYVYWMEHLDNQGNFGPLQLIDGIGISPYFIEDLDLDGNLDFLCWNRFMDVIFWKKNTDGIGNYGPNILISDQEDFPYIALPADLNGDGWPDIVTSTSEHLAWYPHTGLGIDEYPTTKISIHPNPTNDLIHILGTSASYSGQLFSSSGQLLSRFESVHELDLSAYPSGLYFLNIRTADGSSQHLKVIRN